MLWLGHVRDPIVAYLGGLLASRVHFGLQADY
jgi:hypothetical protein